MQDLYQSFANTFLGKRLLSRLNFPIPCPLRRHSPAHPLIEGPFLVSTESAGILNAIAQLDPDIQFHKFTQENLTLGFDTCYQNVLVDARPVRSAGQLSDIYRLFHRLTGYVKENGNILIITTKTEDPMHAATQQAIVGFMKSLAKELGKFGITVNNILVNPNAETFLQTSLLYLLSRKSAYVSGQTLEISKGRKFPKPDWQKPLQGQTALVTGACGGIGQSIVRSLAADGAQVLCLDTHTYKPQIKKLAEAVQGHALALDITKPNAAGRIQEEIQNTFGKLDILVHNAGITRDKTIARMTLPLWQQVLDVNLESPLLITQRLIETQTLAQQQSRVIFISSITGLAGNYGQSNYSASKAGILGYMHALNQSHKHILANAVAPGFIETSMTAQMPLPIREVAKRMNAMAQAGLPTDVAQAVSFLTHPASSGVRNQTLRVCGLALVGR